MSFNVRNKKESRDLIQKLGVNTVPEIFANKNDINKIEQFFLNNKAELYVIRHSRKADAHYEYVKNFDEFKNVLDNFENEIIVAVSINSYKNKILLGAIEVDGNKIHLCATTNPKLDHRTIYNGTAEYMIETVIFDNELDRIPQIKYLFDYIQKYSLYNVTIEFTIYDRPVGINNEKIIINEIRNY